MQGFLSRVDTIRRTMATRIGDLPGPSPGRIVTNVHSSAVHLFPPELVGSVSRMEPVGAVVDGLDVTVGSEVTAALVELLLMASSTDRTAPAHASITAPATTPTGDPKS